MTSHDVSFLGWGLYVAIETCYIYTRSARFRSLKPLNNINIIRFYQIRNLHLLINVLYTANNVLYNVINVLFIVINVLYDVFNVLDNVIHEKY